MTSRWANRATEAHDRVLFTPEVEARSDDEQNCYKDLPEYIVGKTARRSL